MERVKSVACVFYAATFFFALLALMNALALGQAHSFLIPFFINALVFFLLALMCIACIAQLRMLK